MIPSRSSFHRFALGGAWLLVVVTLLQVLFAASVKWGDPGGTFKTYHTVVNGRSHDALGLTYAGLPGLLAVTAQLLLVGAAVAVTTLRAPRLLRLRRAGHAVLCGWALLWALNLGWLAAVDGLAWSRAQAAVAWLLCGCTVYRAAAGWRLRPAPPQPARGQARRAAVPQLIPDPPAGGPAAGGTPPDDPPVRGAAPGPVRARLDGARAWAGPKVIAGRRKAASGLYHVAEFARRQAGRVAPNTGE